MKLAIIGCGAVIEAYHLPLLKALSDRIRVVGCFDRDLRRAELMADVFQIRRFGQVEDALQSPGDIEAVLIATPPSEHASLIGSFLDIGAHVFVEKPLVTRAADARAVVAKASDAGRRLLVGHFRRYYPSVQSARDYFRAGGIGKAGWAWVSEGRLWSWPAKSSYAFTSPAGGVGLDTGSHGLDMLLYILGLDEEEFDVAVNRVEKDRRPEPSHDVAASVTLKMSADTFRVDMAFSRLRPLAQVVKIRGEAESWLVTPTAYSGSSTRIAAAMPFAVSTPVLDYSPPNQISAFYCQYLDLLRCVAEPSYRSRAEGSRFIGLTKILEAVTEA